MNLKSKCDRCDKMVEETSTASCAIGSFEVAEYLPQLDKYRYSRLCSFDDQFFCHECMDGHICVDCAKVLTKEEKEVLKAANKI